MIKPLLYSLLAALLICGCTEAVPEVKKPSPKKVVTDGVVVKKNEGSNTTSAVSLKKGIRDGEAKQYYENGTIWKEVNYKGGRLDGEAKIYDTEGRLQRIVTYKEGINHGKLVKYFKSGNPKVEAEYNEGMPIPGIIERNYKGEAIKQPEITSTREDNMFKANEYNVIFKLDKKAKDVKFYAGETADFWNPKTNLGVYMLPKYKGSKDQFVASFNVPKGYFLAQQLHVYATYTSSTGEDAVTYTSINIAAENPGY